MAMIIQQVSNPGNWKNQAKIANETGDTQEEELAKQHAINAKAFGEHVKDITEEYQIAFIEWVTGNIPQNGSIDNHHIVPSSWRKENIQGNLIHSILNRTPLSAETNRDVINDKLPNK